MEVDAPTDQARRKAVLIDDAFLRPSADDLRLSLSPLRRFLRNVPVAKEWFDTNFGLRGSPSDRSYFEPLLGDHSLIVRLWERRTECPESTRLLQEGLAELVAEVAPLRQPLEEVERTLTEQSWDLVRFGELPKLGDIPRDASLVVIDYVLTADTPADLPAKVAESTKLLQELVARAAASSTALPLVILVSSRPNVDRGEAEAFRKAVGLHGGFFHFIRKFSVLQELVPRIEGFTAEVTELESYRRVHTALQSALRKACNLLLDDIEALELQDLAALHVGHLIHEGEPLSDYVGWMLGQALTAKLQESVDLADASAVLPPENHRVLLGHLQPTQGIPKLFSEASTVNTASGQRHKQKKGALELRFGDMFVGRRGRTVDLTRFRLVLSQTCDLLQGKITNGQVLCAEGTGTLITHSEAALMKATLRQLDNKGSTLIRFEEGQYYQVEWAEVNLVSEEQAKLKRERGFRYVGRLNEIYALEVQHNALNRLGRIGVPVKPGYGLVFGEVRIKFWTAKAEHSALARTFNNRTVIAVLRPLTKGQIAILLSSEVKKWFVTTVEASLASIPSELTETAKQLIAWIKADTDFRFFCKQLASGVLSLGVTIEKLENGTTVKSTSWQNKLAIDFGGATLFPNAIIAAQGPRIQLEFIPIT